MFIDYIFSSQEVSDIRAAARERGVSVIRLIRNAVLDSIAS